MIAEVDEPAFRGSVREFEFAYRTLASATRLLPGGHTFIGVPSNTPPGGR